MGNALKFTEEGEVAVKVDPGFSDGRTPAAIAVADTGIGIPPERLQAIFEAFQQADGTTGRKYGGTGLGLTISRSLCQLMGFDLQVESEEGKGSTFTILLTDVPSPVRGPEQELVEEALRPMESTRPMSAAAGAARGSRPEPAIGPRVLVIDDDPGSRTLLVHQLEGLGYAVTSASSGEEGLEVARQSKPDLVTLDLLMPDMTGWEALRELKADPSLQDVPVVIVSVVAGSDDRGNLLGRRGPPHQTGGSGRPDEGPPAKPDPGQGAGRPGCGG